VVLCTPSLLDVHVPIIKNWELIQPSSIQPSSGVGPNKFVCVFGLGPLVAKPRIRSDCYEFSLSGHLTWGYMTSDLGIHKSYKRSGQ
jgi:hypothetical protein